MTISAYVWHKFNVIALSALVLVFSAVSSSANEPLPVDQHAKLPVEELTLVSSAGEFRFSVEIADTDKRRQVGLMFREQMLPTHGMLFDFAENELVAMWMKNTPLSLDMVFIRPNGTIARIAKNTTPFSKDIISSGEPVSHVLELNAGITVQIGLKEGDVVKHRFFNPAD